MCREEYLNEEIPSHGAAMQEYHSMAWRLENFLCTGSCLV